jgi:hypothetical protein
MKTYRQFLWIILLLIPLFWWAWPSGDKTGQDKDSQSGSGAGKHLLDAKPGMVTRRMRDGGDPSELSGVDRILADDGISHKQAALQLRELAMNPMSSVEARLEALEHGLLLDADSFADFAQQKDLPSELASHYLQKIINQNDSPAIQIRGYMALMDHPDAEVAGLAKEMLALEVGDEEQLSTREKLLVVGQGKLAKLESEVEK